MTRVVVVDDSSLFRLGLVALLGAAGVDVVADLPSAEGLVERVVADPPDVVVLDVRLPPTFTDEGIRTALRLRREAPGTGVLMLSTYVENAWARALFAEGASGLGYLLKDRVDDVAMVVDAVERVAANGAVVDPEVVAQLLEPSVVPSALDVLSPREREVIALMAEGRSNVGIGRSMHVSPRTVEAYIASIFAKLPMETADTTVNRRVLAVLTYLDSRGVRG